MSEAQARKSKITDEKLGEQYRDKAFSPPTHYTLAKAVNFASIRKRMFAKREQSRSDTIKDTKDTTKDTKDTTKDPKDEKDDSIYANDADLLRDLLPTAVEQEKFWLWVHTEDKLARTMPEAREAKEYFNALAHTDYSNESSLRQLFAVLQAYAYPYIPAGSHNDYRYRLNPSLTTLGPDDDRTDFDDTRDFAAEPIIAVTLVGKQIRCKDEREDRNRRRRKDDTDSSYHSESSTESSIMGNDSTGFVCFQIGKLLAAEEEYWSANGKLSKDEDAPWTPTDWVMVVVIDADNTAGAVWLLQNFEPTIENTSDQYMIDEADPYRWGYFEGDLQKSPRPMQRGGVKIAHKITDLSKTFQWTQDEYILGKYDILQAVLAERSGDGAPFIIRQFLPAKADDSTPDVSGLSFGDDY
ncbi:hypothetical protein J4E93_008346 [Alternaria ventricosa]|uniref:uncharacterized protein n=1 Tax=Alternaria ventricosa TaxID=1187951 RepID=UPI0020C2F166|nr:uncharacterized protein J4E93_008346 [Alternaria ventricosa]KAI4640754.1 hypothetical protein J4E93_008346 [Alternaria ventricosa]